MINTLKSYCILVVTLTAVAMIMAALAMIKLGNIDVNSDSVSYMSIADNILAGNGIRMFDSREHSLNWPPGYPIVLAAVSGSLRVSAYHAGIVVSILSYGAIILVSLVWLKDMTQNRLSLVVGVVIIITSAPLLHLSRLLMADIMFVAIITVGIYCLHKAYRDDYIGWRVTLIIAAVAAAATMTRWLGISLGITATIILLIMTWRRVGLIPSSVYLCALIPATASLSFAFAWAIIDPTRGGSSENNFMQIVVSSVLNPTASPAQGLIEHVIVYVKRWLVPPGIISIPEASWFQVVGWTILIGLSISYIWVMRRGALSSKYAVPLIFILVYITVLLLATTTFWANALGTTSPSPRRIAPIYIPLAVIMVTFLLGGINRRGDVFALCVKRSVGIVIVSLVVITSSFGLYRTLIDFNDNNPWVNYSWAEERDSEFAVNLRNLATDDLYIYSNYPPRAYLLWERPARTIFWAESKRRFFSEQSEYEPPSKGDYVVWFSRKYRPYKEESSEAEAALDLSSLTVVYDDDFGTIYRVTTD